MSYLTAYQTPDPISPDQVPEPSPLFPDWNLLDDLNCLPIPDLIVFPKESIQDGFGPESDLAQEAISYNEGCHQNPSASESEWNEPSEAPEQKVGKSRARTNSDQT